MSSPSARQKRKQGPNERDVSPPSLKRKFQSTTTRKCVQRELCFKYYLICASENAVASFFTPSSQKEPEKTTWTTVDKSLLVAHYWPSVESEAQRRREKRRKIAAFDFVRCAACCQYIATELC